jgi:hypothetical protein
MLMRGQFRITQHPDIHLMWFSTMPTIPTIATEGNSRRSEQDHLPRLPHLSGSLKRCWNLTGGLRA